MAVASQRSDASTRQQQQISNDNIDSGMRGASWTSVDDAHTRPSERVGLLELGRLLAPLAMQGRTSSC